MSAAGITADPFTYEALAAGCAMVGDWRSAEALVRDMLNERNRYRARAATVHGTS